MRLQPKAAFRLTYKLRLTPQMRLSINLLQIPLIKLKEFIKRQAEENPLIDIENIKIPSRQEERSEEYPNIENEREFEPMPQQENYNFEDEKKRNYRESLITTPITLREHLLRQLLIFTSSGEDRVIGELIIENLDDNGYLTCPIEEIAKSATAEPSHAAKVLSLVQTFDPIGAGARDLRECLLLQLKANGKDNSLAWQIVDKYLLCLEKKRYAYISGKLNVSEERIGDEVREIANLEPKPGRSFNAERPINIIPDAILRRDKKAYAVIYNDWDLPHLSINEKYKQILKQKGASGLTKEYIRERIRAARSLINAIRRRKETIQKIIEEIVSSQKDFFNKGADNLKPLTLKQIANRIKKHTSTVSRAIANKYIQTPSGILELRYFLSPGVKQKNGGLFSSKAIKSRIQRLIETENKNNPLIDYEIVQHFKQEGIFVARRTIAKYRNQLKILPYTSRRE